MIFCSIFFSPWPSSFFLSDALPPDRLDRTFASHWQSPPVCDRIDRGIANSCRNPKRADPPDLRNHRLETFSNGSCG